MVMAIFYLTQWQPNFLPFWAVFLCGLCYDILQSSLFGSHALMLLTFRLALGHLRQKTGFIPSATKSWMLFIPVAIGYFVFEWLFISFQANDYRIPAHLLQRDLISLLLYPLVHIGLSSIIIRIQSSR